jgi:hypothetical protein
MDRQFFLYEFSKTKSHQLLVVKEYAGIVKDEQLKKK